MSNCRANIIWKLKTMTISVLLALVFSNYGAAVPNGAADQVQVMANSLIQSGSGEKTEK
jgi:hypothetical protein